MDGLGGALRELARDADPADNVDASTLWQQGRRRVRRRRAAGGLVVAAIAVTAIVAGSLVPNPTVTMPAGDPHAPAIPKNLHNPNRFLAGVSEEGPPGRLAAIAGKGSDEGAGPWYGVSATTGEYLYLDLPDIADGSPMRLSPDGHLLAYWITGPTRKKDFGPRTIDSAGGPLPDKPVAGVAVYDTRDGSVTRHRITTDYGLWPGDEATLSWLDGHTLVFGYSVATGTNTSRGGGSHLWVLGGEPERLPGDELEDARYVPAFGGSELLRDDASLTVVDTRARPTGRTVVISQGGVVPDAVTFAGDLVVKTGDDPRTSPGPNRVLAGRDAGDGGQVVLTPVGDILWPHFLGWLSPTRILVTAHPAQRVDGDLEVKPAEDSTDEEYKDAPRAMYEVDLSTRTVQRLGEADVGSLQVATDLLDEPFAHGRRPPSLFEVFRMPIGIGGLVLAVGFACWVWVRRRRRGQG